MTKAQAIKHFGSQSKLAAALGLTQPAISMWAEVPALYQLRLERLTDGKLKAAKAAWTGKK